jgi:hypothetical protein
MKTIVAVTSVSALLLATTGFAAGPRTDQVVQRDVNQQQRIEQGLQTGELSTREAGQLEREEARINHTEAHALKDGSLSKNEQARLNSMKNKASSDIYADKHDTTKGNPNSASSQRMQADVQRNVNQQQRILQGAQSGTLTNRETARLERGQSHVDAREAKVARNGGVSAGEQARTQRAENRQSRRIVREKHNAHT